MLSLLKQGTQHGVRSKKSHKGRLKCNILGILKNRQAQQIKKQGSLTKADLKASIQKQSSKEAKIANKQTNANGYNAQAEAPRVTIQIYVNSLHSKNSEVGPRMSWLIIKQPTFGWSAKDKHGELRSFKVEVNMLEHFNKPSRKSINYKELAR